MTLDEIIAHGKTIRPNYGSRNGEGEMEIDECLYHNFQKGHVSMGTYYSIYAEARVGKKWYNISPLIKGTDGLIKAYPIIDGKSFLRETYDELKDDLYMCGRPADLSPELREIFDHDDDESYDCFTKTYKQHYENCMFLVNYGKSVKSRVKKDRPFRYQGYVFKYSIASYEIGEQEEIAGWLTRQEYESLSEEEKKDYAYFEWNEWQDWYGVYNDIVHRVDALLHWFSEWSSYQSNGVDYEDKYPSADKVRLIVYRC